MRTFDGVDDLSRAVGARLGQSAWRVVTQGEVDLFAAAIGDRNWTHIDPERARSGPFGGTISPGYLTLALVPKLVREIYSVPGFAFSLDRGTDKVRLPTVLRVGLPIRASAELASVEPALGGSLVHLRVVVELAGSERPVCTAETVTLLCPSVVDGYAGSAGTLGTHASYSNWRTVTQRDVDLFAEATGQDHWIHVDPARAAEGPFEVTVVQGSLVLSLIPDLVDGIVTVDGVEASLNYGPNQVRFPGVLPVGSRIRAGVEPISEMPTSLGIRETLRVTIEREDGNEPVCVAETVNVLIPRAVEKRSD